jgi:dihydrofolate reductase
MKLHLIFARAANGVIGKNNALPWHLPEDMAHFKRTTLGCPVIMGRKTWDSLPARFRPLPGRLNIVLTRQADWQEDGVQRFADLPQALQFCAQHEHVWVIGGAQVYAQAEPLASSAVVTELEASFDGDAFAPQFGPGWAETAREHHVSSNGLKFSFVTYTRNKGS